MHEVRSRRLAGWAVGVVLVMTLAACHGGGSKGATASGGVAIDSKSACAALAGLQRSGDALRGVNVADPVTSLAALGQAVSAYSAALLTFERVGPADLRAHAVAVRAAVMAHHFGQAAVDREAIDAWATTHCTS